MGWGWGCSGRQKMEREKERTRDASLQMRGLEARRQFKQALAPSQAWQTAHSYPLSFPHTLSHTHAGTRIYIHAHTSQSCMLAHKAIAKRLNRQYSGSTNVPEVVRKVSTVRLHTYLYICKISRFSKVSTPLQQKPWKATGERPARGCLSKQQFTYTHLCSCTLRLQGTCRSVTVKT